MESDDLTTADAAQLTDPAGHGAVLRTARDTQRLDLSHIASETRIPLRHLEAIEAGNFESLPSRTHAIGFTRTYAKALGLDDAPIVEAVRAQLPSGSMGRTVPSPGIEPGDPAQLPSKGLAWAAAGAVLVLGIGVFAFYKSNFGAGAVPGSPPDSDPQVSASGGTTQLRAAVSTAPTGPVVFTALEDGVWVRLYEQDRERLTERLLKQGETLDVPPTARDPRINTGRPDALGVTIGGQPVAKLAEKPETMLGVAVSAAALAARGAAPAALPADAASAPASSTAPPRAQQRAPQRAPRRTAPRPASNGAEPVVTDPGAAAPASEPAPTNEPPAPSPPGL
jgi:hypothetical protein